MLNKVNELLNYAMYQDDELGECCIKLCSMYERRDMVSDEFVTLLEKEINEKLDAFKSYAELVTTEVTFTKKVTELIWTDE
jgi:hypothetical protein